nr:endonuclease III [uncultured Criibacterium sp.]
MTLYQKIINKLKQMYPEAHCELDFSSEYELLVATILSAQSTDKRVNIVTKELFKVANSPQKMLELGEEKLKEYIRTIGFYNAKSKNIIKMSEQLVEDFNSKAPSTMEELTTLAGVGRKTANVVLSNCFGVQAIAVDTHVFRLAHRLGFSDENDVYKVELDLNSKIKKSEWSLAHHLLIFHGRRVCKAKNPLCEQCGVNMYCRYYKGSVQQ